MRASVLECERHCVRARVRACERPRECATNVHVRAIDMHAYTEYMDGRADRGRTLDTRLERDQIINRSAVMRSWNEESRAFG